MSSRIDISDSLIHFTKAATYQEALETLLAIVSEGRLIAGNGMIRGGYRCVCFTEAPLAAVANGLVNAGSFTRYVPFGLMFSKRWLYERGGRPVIYQADAEFRQLPEAVRWRHVCYEPNATPPIDFTWEREWRICQDELYFAPNEAALVVPNADWKSVVFQFWDFQQQLTTDAYFLVMDKLLVAQMEEPCPWRVVSLEG